MMHKNSLEANAAIEPTKPTARGQVFGVIHEHGTVTRQEIAARLGWAINRVTGRVKELIEKGVIEECGTVRVNNKPRALLRVKRREAA